MNLSQPKLGPLYVPPCKQSNQKAIENIETQVYDSID